MALKWFVCRATKELRAPHPVYREEGSELFYEIVCLDMNAGSWALKFEGAIINEGSLLGVVKHADADARFAMRTYRIACLRRDIMRAERSQGGNWRKLRSLQAKREKLERMMVRK